MESRSWLYMAGVASIVGAIALVAVPAVAGQRVRVKASDRVLLLGDSLAQGLGGPMGALARDAGIAFDADGRVSTRIDQWLDNGWAEERIAALRPTIVLVSLGTNLSPSFATRAAAFVTMAQRYGTTVLWIEPPTMPFDTSAVLTGIRESGAASFRSQDVTIPRGPDNIHPTMAGYAAWAAMIWQSLDPPRALAGLPRPLGSAPMPARSSLLPAPSPRRFDPARSPYTFGRAAGKKPTSTIR